MEKVLTIVIPSYNVEKFLNKTLDSFLDESILDSIEVLIVDDGSKDHTAEIGRSYQEKYPDTFRLIRKENGGHGSTINKGFELASGKYFKVVDGDDWVDTKEFVQFVHALKACDSDFVVTNYSEVSDVTFEKKKVEFDTFQKMKEYRFEEIFDQIQFPMHALSIKTEIFQEHKIRLDEHSFYVDVEYVLFPVIYVETVTFLDYNVYMYRVAQATQSVSMQGFQKHIQNHIDVTLHLVDFLNTCEKNGVDSSRIHYISVRTAQMVRSQCQIFESYPVFEKGNKARYRAFDGEIKSKNSTVYRLSDLGKLAVFRKMNFHGYAVIMAASKLYKKITGNGLC